MAEFARAWTNPSGRRRWKLGVDGGDWRQLGSRGNGKGVGRPWRIWMGEEGRLFRSTKKWGLRERGEVERERTGSW